MTKEILRPTAVYDLAFRDIFRKGGRQFLKALGMEPGEVMDTDVSTLTKRNVDLIVQSNGQINHVEFQRSPSPRMAIRMLDYFGSILRISVPRDDATLPMIKQVVVQVGNSEPTGWIERDFGHASIRYVQVNSGSIPAGLLIKSGDVYDAVLSIICGMRIETALDLIRAATRRLVEPGTVDAKDLLNQFLALSGASKRSDLVLEVFQEMHISVTEDDFPIAREWMERGEKKGVVDSIVRQAHQRSGYVVSQDTRTSLLALPMDDLNDLLDKLPDAENVEVFIDERLPEPDDSSDFRI